MSSYTNPSATLEALLRNACRRALNLGLSFTSQVRLYRSIIALAREVRLRCGGLRQDAGNQTLATLLAEVCDNAGELGLDPELPLPDAILVQRLTVQLSRAARQAGGIESSARRFSAQNPMHPEEPTGLKAEAPISSQNPMHPEEPTDPEAEAPISQQNPIHRENNGRDDHLSAWRNDHTTDRDQKAHELLRTVIEERSFAKVKAMNERDREEREAIAQAHVA